MQTIITRQTAAGQTVTLGIDGERIVAAIDGAIVTDNLQTLGSPVDHPAGRITHAIGKVAIFESEITQLEAAAETPAMALDKLRNQRRAIVQMLNGAIADAQADAGRRWDNGEMDHADGWSDNSTVSEWRARLAEFDAAHPEIA